jgi:hypothetical protein
MWMWMYTHILWLSEHDWERAGLRGVHSVAFPLSDVLAIQSRTREMSSHCRPLSVTLPALETTTGPSAPPAEFCFDFGGSAPRATPEPDDRVADTADGPAEDPATSQKKGSFYSDKKGTFYALEWPDFAEFDAWRRAEEIAHSIEFRRSSVWTGGALWTSKRLYRCGRQVTGGGKYEITDPKRKRVESKKIGCPCHIIIKVYPHTSTILGRYVEKHNHELGRANIRHTDISHEARDQVKTLLERKIDRREIVSKPYSIQ